MSATDLDPDIEAIVEEFSDLLRRRIYELRGAYSGALEAQLLAAAEKLRAAARPWPKAADCGPTATEISAEDSQTNCEQTVSNLSIEEPSIEPSWLVEPSNASIPSIDFVPSAVSTIDSLSNDTQ